MGCKDTLKPSWTKTCRATCGIDAQCIDGTCVCKKGYTGKISIKITPLIGIFILHKYIIYNHFGVHNCVKGSAHIFNIGMH